MKRIAIVMTVMLAVLFTSDGSFAKDKPGRAEKRSQGSDEYAKRDKARHHKNKHHKAKHYKADHYDDKHGKAKRHNKAHHREKVLRIKRPQHHVVHEIVHQRGGPPPWAPAHGYRHQHHDRQHEVNYVVPFGIASSTCHRDALGSAIGAAGGGLLAAELSGGDARAIFGGVLAGALLGGALGDAANGVDRDCFGQALEHAPSSETIEWRNPDEDTTYQFTPTRTYEIDEGTYCRDYTTQVTIGGRQETARGTACRQPDGSWESR